MNTKQIIFFISLFAIFFQNCEKYHSTLDNTLGFLNDIPYDYLDTYENLNQDIDVGYNIKNGLVETGAGELMFVGTTPDTTILIASIGIGGDVTIPTAEYEKGWAHGIIKAIDLLNYIVVGTTIDNDVFLMKIRPSGEVVHFKKFKAVFNTPEPPVYGPGQVEEVVGYDVAITADSNYVITGYFKQSIGNERLYTLKVSDRTENFEFEWLRTYFNNTPTVGTSIVTANDGKLVISGYRKGLTAMFKMDKNGYALWDKIYGKSSADYFNKTLNKSNGSHIVIGSRFGLFSNRIFLGEVASDLTNIKEEDYGDDSDGNESRGYYVQETRDGGYIMLGKEQHKNQLKLIKIDSDLSDCDSDDKFCFSKNYSSSDYEIPVAVLQQKNLEYNFGFIVCTLSSYNGIDYSLRVFKTDETGEIR